VKERAVSYAKRGIVYSGRKRKRAKEKESSIWKFVTEDNEKEA